MCVRKRMWMSGLIYESGLAEQHQKLHERAMIIYITWVDTHVCVCAKYMKGLGYGKGRPALRALSSLWHINFY